MADLDFLNSKQGYLGEMSWCFFCALISFIPLFHYMCHICKLHGSRASKDALSSKASTVIETLTTSSMTAFTIALLTRGSYALLRVLDCRNKPIVVTLAGCPRLFWAIGTALIHLLFIKRFQYAFQGTVHTTSKRVYLLLYLAIFIFVTLNIGVVVHHILHHFVVLDETTYMIVNLCFTLCYVLIDLAVSVGLVYLFIQKLFVIIVQIDPTLHWKQQQQQYFTDSPTQKRYRVTLSNEQSSFLHVITKYFILNVIAIVSTQIAQMMAMTAEVVEISSKHESDMYHLLEDMFWMLWILDCCINSVCSYLQLDLSQAMYAKLCRGLHIWCALWCNRVAIRKVQKKEVHSNYVRMTEDQYAL